MRPHEAGPEVVRRLLLGERRADIARSMGINPTTVYYHAVKLGLARRRPDLRKPIEKKFDWVAICAMYAAGATYAQCKAKFGVSKSAMWKAKTNGILPDLPPKLRESLSDDEYFKAAVGRRTTSLRFKIRRRIIAAGLVPYVCAICGIDKWNGGEIGLHLDHIDGDSRNNLISNSLFLCPNCDSQTETFLHRNTTDYSSPFCQKTAGL